MEGAEEKPPQASAEVQPDIDVMRIMELIPHRYPLLMIDRVTGVVLEERATGIKNVTINEPFFQGHFPDRPVMPGVLIIEAMAQTAAVLVIHSLARGATPKAVYPYFMTIDEARFRRPVLPGDRLPVHVERQRRRGNVWKFAGRAEVDGKLVAEASIGAMIMEG
jgi:3-hydroxyacyl-[acyl-carrier-protein] dehydratase